MVSDLDLYGLAAPFPEGVAAEADTGALITGRLLGLDIENGLAQVSVAGSEGLWVPALPAIYRPHGAVRLLRSALDGSRITSCLGPVVPGQMLVGGKVITVAAAVGLLTVETLGARFELPYAPGTYAPGTAVHVIRSTSSYGRPEFVLGPSGNYNPANPGQPGGGSENGGSLVTRQTTILPVWSGSWRARFGRWDSWNTDRYGGRSTLWQGDGYNSGPMAGLAVYGDQIAALRAEEILSITARVWRADSSVAAGKVAVLQPSPDGEKPAGAPTISPALSASSPALTPNEVADVAMPGAVLDGFRTGAFRGIVTVGAEYAGFNGTPDRAPIRADGMALTVQFAVRQ